MKPTIATILGTVAFGILKGKLGSTVKIFKEDKRLLTIPGIGVNLNYVLPEEFGLEIEDEVIKNADHRNRLILYPVKNSSIIKAAGLYLNWISLGFDEQEDPEFGLTYEAFLQYVLEPYEDFNYWEGAHNSLNAQTLSEEVIKNHESISSAFSRAQQDLLDIYGEIMTSDFDPYFVPIEYDISHKVKHCRVTKIPLYFTLDKNGEKISLSKHKFPTREEIKLRRR